MFYEVEGKVFVITGAAGGIGSCVVKSLLEENVKHVVILDVNEKDGVALRDDLISKFGRKVSFIKCDVTNDDQLTNAFKTIKDEQDYIDVVINNAALMNDSMAVYKKEIDINFTALVTGTLKAVELMRKDQGGRGGTVINISSIAGLYHSPLLPIYFATKAAVIHFSTCFSMDHEYYNKTGVRVITICFGKTDTSLLSMAKLGRFDEDLESKLGEISKLPNQNPKAAAKGLIDVYKKGKHGSTWIVTSNKPAKDITETIKKAYKLTEQHVCE